MTISGMYTCLKKHRETERVCIGSGKDSDRLPRCFKIETL